MNLKLFSIALVASFPSSCEESDRSLKVDPSLSVSERLELLTEQFPEANYQRTARNVARFDRTLPDFIPSLIQISRDRAKDNHLTLIVDGLATNPEFEEFLFEVGSHRAAFTMIPIGAHPKESEILAGHGIFRRLGVSIPFPVYHDFVSGKANGKIFASQRDETGKIFITSSDSWSALENTDYSEGGVVLLPIEPENLR